MSDRRLTASISPIENDHANRLLILAAIVALCLVIFCGVLYVTSPIATLETSQDATLQAANIISNAIATPPAPVPAWLSFIYPWQTIASSIFALDAALVGAWALMKQADASRRAVRDQIAAADQAERDRYIHDAKITTGEIERDRKQTAGAIASELRTWLNRFGDMELWQLFKSQLTTASNEIAPVVPKIPIFVDRFPVYEALCGKIGLFSGMVPGNIVTAYGTLQGLLDSFKGIRLGDYDFLNDKFHSPENSQSLDKFERDKARRAKWGLEDIVRDLHVFYHLARPLVDDLNRIHGNDLPPVPEWWGPPVSRD
jgi:hypothetical protein